MQGAGYTSFKDVPIAQIKKITAQRLLESKQTIPHYYLTIDCKVDKLVALRKQLNEALASGQGGKLSVNDFIIKASALVSPCAIFNFSRLKDFAERHHYFEILVFFTRKERKSLETIFLQAWKST